MSSISIWLQVHLPFKQQTLQFEERSRRFFFANADTIAAKTMKKKLLQRKCFGAINFVKLQKNHFTKQIPWPVLLKKGHTSGSNITKKIFWWNYFCNNYKNYCKTNVPRNYFVIISAGMVRYIILRAGFWQNIFL